jgi:hypothetical protein
MNSLLQALGRPSASRRVSLFLLALALLAPSTLGAAEPQQTFPTAKDAVAALAAAVKAQDMDALHALFGPAVSDVVNPDRVQATNEFRAFADALEAGFRIVPQSDSRCLLEVGTDRWPFPIPVVRRASVWIFDTAGGKEELLNRRIGRDELAVLKVMRAFVDAQREYASLDRDGDQVLEYAQRLGSTPGTQDGLYWEPTPSGDLSPLGPLVAEAQFEGYNLRQRAAASSREPFHGYYFKILTQQGKHAPGGKYNYIINGNMIGGFALIAWPAEYGQTGIMTFTVNQQGRVYQRDLGPKTTRLAKAITSYDPDSAWSISAD